MGTAIVVRRDARGWKWNVLIVEECVASGKSSSWKNARTDAKKAMDAWLSMAWRIALPGTALTQEQKRLVAHFKKIGG